MAKREFLMLAQPISKKFGPMGAYASEKLDGMRCFWDGGASRGLACSEVPYANTAKHERFVEAPTATGLWTRYGQPIQAPASFLDQLPLGICLDGELTCGRGTFQRTVSIVKTHIPDPDGWSEIKYAIFDRPAYADVFADGTINNAFFKKRFSGIRAWLLERGLTEDVFRENRGSPFYQRHGSLRKLLPSEGTIYRLEQRQIDSGSYAQADKDVDAFFREILDLGGEGLILKSPICPWVPERTSMMVKVKGINDMEGTVIGYSWASPTNMTTSISGEATDKLLGLMGNLMLRLDNGKIFNLGSGFTESEREMHALGYSEANGCGIARTYGCMHAGEEVDLNMHNNLKFPLGSRVSFRYRELSDDGIPKEARYYRPRPEE